MTNTTICESCGKRYGVGDSPFCRDQHAPARTVVVPDDVPGGFWAENGFDRPTWFPSHSAHEAALAARGLEIRAKYAGDGYERHLTNWAAGIDAKTLENVTALLSRGSVSATERERERLAAVTAEFPIAVRKVEA